MGNILGRNTFEVKVIVMIFLIGFSFLSQAADMDAFSVFQEKSTPAVSPISDSTAAAVNSAVAAVTTAVDEAAIAAQAAKAAAETPSDTSAIQTAQKATQTASDSVGTAKEIVAIATAAIKADANTANVSESAASIATNKAVTALDAAEKAITNSVLAVSAAESVAASPSNTVAGTAAKEAAKTANDSALIAKDKAPDTTPLTAGAEDAKDDYCDDRSDGKLKIEPNISPGAENLSPGIAFKTRKCFRSITKAYLGILASSKPSLEDPVELAKNYAAEGGDVNFNLGLLTAIPGTKGKIVIDTYVAYSLFSGDEVSTEEDSTLDIEAEISSIGLGGYVDFNEAILGLTIARHHVSNEETASEFSKLVDGKESISVSVAIPLKRDGREIYLKFLRTHIEDLDSADFRVMIQMSL